MADSSARLLSHSAAQADTRQLARLLAEAHPDPYLRGGGKVAFHRRVEDVVATVPEAGLTAAELLRLLRPVVAAVGDGHTAIYDPDDPDEAVDRRAEPGLATQARPWIEWEIVEERLYVASVYRESDRRLLGARLDAVGDVPFDALAARMGELRGYDNVYNNLVHLANALAHQGLLGDLLGLDGTPDKRPLTLAARDGAPVDVTLPFSIDPPGDLIEPPSALALAPFNAARLAWQLLDERTALLRIGPMMWYREAFEVWRSMGSHHTLGHHLEATARRALGADPPDDIDGRIAAVPSATEFFQDLFAALRAADVGTLLVDLRGSTGGNSHIATILAWFLHGPDALAGVDAGYQVRRHSDLYYDNNRGVLGQAVEYDFADQDAWERRRTEGQSAATSERALAALGEDAARMPTFAAVYRAGWTAGWTPRVVVLTSARTYSAGFDLAALLYKLGALVVGVPSSQAGNCFIDTLRFTLANSGLKGRVSHKWSLLFPDDPATGHLLRPHVELTHERWVDLAFDPHATIRLAVEALRDG